MRRNIPSGVKSIVLAFVVTWQCAASDGLADEPRILVTVNGDAVTQADLETAYLIRGMSSEHQASLRRRLLERLVDESLIAAFLEQRRIKPSTEVLDAQLERIEALIRQRGEEPDELLSSLGLDRDKIRKQLSLQLAWREFAQNVITLDQIRHFFSEHRRELDGTQVRARHILLKVAADAPQMEWEKAKQQLETLRQGILSMRKSFSEAAREVSEAPSSKEAGDVGFFSHRGTMAPEFADAAFELKPGEISPPVRTPAGMHLIEVTEERPGQLSLEDVRESVFERLAAELWDQQIATERARAKIVWEDAGDEPAAP